MPEIEQKSKVSQEKRAEIQAQFDQEDIRVRNITEKLRADREKIEQPLQRMQNLGRNLKLQIDGWKQEIESLRSKKDKIAGEREQLQNLASMQ